MKYYISEVNEIHNIENEERYENIIQFCKRMRILHYEALGDEDYCDNYYSAFHRIMNHGGLCLVSKLYFKFAEEVMKKICNLVTVDAMLNQKRKRFLTDVKHTFLNNNELFLEFCNVDKDSDFSKKISEEDKKEVFQRLIKLVIHAKSGAVVKEVDEKFVGKGMDVSLRNKLKTSVMKSSMKKTIELKNKNKKRKLEENQNNKKLKKKKCK